MSGTLAEKEGHMPCAPDPEWKFNESKDPIGMT